ncbi:MAG TPA: crotonase/enoyl-CoA hydratase family protein [Steroidobacteraceae bacterium]|nr:crotonase/enoyl-CoA hydratase family protein [Steroidobacteraceae bacterium]
MSVSVTRIDRVALIRMMRPERRNAVDAATAKALADAFRAFDADASLDVAVFTGAHDVFCAGADLKALASADRVTLSAGGDSPMGPARLRLSKPVIAAIEGPAVAGGLELVLWCDLRIAGESAIFGVFNRRFGIPLVDLGTIRLPRIIGHGRAMDLILTGRSVDAAEALAMGLINRRVPDGEALRIAMELAQKLSGFPQTAMRQDRLSVIEQWGLSEEEAIANEISHGMVTVASGETDSGAKNFGSGAGRHGKAVT